MATMVKSFAIGGIDAYLVDIEVKTMEGQPIVTIIGLGDQAVKEAGERIEAAIDESGYVFPQKRVIISLAPSDKKKCGSHFDLAMAIGVLQQNEDIAAKDLHLYGIIGELALDGRLRACRGILPMIMEAKKKGIKRVIIPIDNMEEASLVQGIEIYGFTCLSDVIVFLEGKKTYYEKEQNRKTVDEAISIMDFSDIRGQNELIDAIVLAAAGGHNMLMIGEPGCGKTMVAQRIPTILPQMTEEECLEVTKIYSISGLLPGGHSLVKNRPFRAPHHHVSLHALIGGGTNALPGEVSLAHNGVLFLDELAEFSKRTLDALRQPVEDKKVCISRVNGSHTYPSNFMFVTAMNPCPCGYYGSSEKECTCSSNDITRSLHKISGPLLDRIDIQVEVQSVDYSKMMNISKEESSNEIKERVNKARKIQEERYRQYNIFSNAELSPKLIEKYCQVDEDSKKLLEIAFKKLNLSSRAYNRILKVSRTIADLEARENISKQDIAEAIQYRSLDKKYS